MIRNEALFVLCLALTAPASAAPSPILDSLKDMAPELSAREVESAPISSVAVEQDEDDGPETVDDIGAAKWFRRQFRAASKPELGKLTGQWGEAARTLPGGNWQAFGTEDRKLDPSGASLFFLDLTWSGPGVYVVETLDWTSSWVESSFLSRSIKFSRETKLEGAIEYETKARVSFACRAIDKDNLICRIRTSAGRKDCEKSYRLYQRLK